MEDETQQNDTPTGERRRRFQQTRELTLGVALPAAAILVTVLTWSHGIFVGILDRIARIDSVVAANSAHRVEHESESEYWVGEIRSNTNAIRVIEQRVAELRSMPQARPDPFTGTDGRKLLQRIERLERE